MIEPQNKIFNPESAVQWRADLRRRGKRLVITNGCFDLLHRGHAEYLLSARLAGDALIVLLNSDESVRSLKGPTRPVNTEDDRAYLLACFEFVDAVLIFDDKRCTNQLKMLQPDVYAKGGDYTVETLDLEERSALLDAGAQIRFIPFVAGHSTTSLLEKARN